MVRQAGQSSVMLYRIDVNTNPKISSYNKA